ncbi:MAG: TRAP transporter substrate-binding protein [Spirochaetia bacterium]|jgi:tripartite ATP-independent transporter DctP family solute receptor|nr:TRAP transporter substrate-binding protein [Spirochaetia bacterium]
MKKMVLLIIAACFLCSVAVYAGGGGEAASPAPSTAKAEPKIVLKIGHSSAATDPREQGALMIKKLAEERSGGSLTVETYPAGQLGGDAALIEALALDSGNPNMLISDLSNFATYEPRMGMSALPFMFSDFDKAWAFMDSEVEADAEKLLIAHNIHVLGHFCNGFRCVTASKIQARTPADMKNMLIRTPENPVIMATMRALGANPQPLAFNEVYMALQQGTYDGQENPIPIIYNNKLYEVQKYLSVTNHIYSGMAVAIAESVWKGMSADQQKILQAAIREAETFNRSTNRKMTEDFISKLETSGMTILKPDLSAFVKATAVVKEDAGKQYGKEWMDRLDAWLKSH